MLKRYRRNSIIIGLLILVGWVFYAMYKNSAIERLYTQHEFNEDIGKIYAELGQLAQDRRDFTAAIPFFKNALHHRPLDLAIYDQLGVCLEMTQKPDEALKLYFHAMSINHNFIEQRFSGDDGVADNVINADELPAHAQNVLKWEGQPLNGKTIYIYSQARLGETIQFCRFLPRLVKLGATVYFRPPTKLYTLIKNAGFPVNLVNSAEEAVRLNVDYYASLLDIMHYTGVGLQDIDNVPYLKVVPSKQSNKAMPEFSNRTFNIGIVWQGDKNHMNDKKRSIPLSFFYDIARMRGVKVYSLQAGFGSEQLKNVPEDVTIVDATVNEKDFADTAAIVAKLDLLISVDTSIAHLGGALGVPTWVLSPYVTDWRWLGYATHGSISWYQNLVVMRQDESCTWQPVFERVQEEISAKLG